MSDTNAHPNKGITALIRWKGLLILACLFSIGVVYGKFFFDHHLRDYLEKVGSTLNYARVDIGELRTSFWRGELEISKLQIAHHTQPMKNLIEVDRIHFRFLLGPLFRKKIVIEEMRATGVHYRTDRESSGLVDKEFALIPKYSSLIDRVANGIYTELRNQSSDNPLRGLGLLLGGIDIAGAVNSFTGLDSMKSIRVLKDDIYKASEQWEKGLKESAALNSTRDFKTRIDSSLRSDSRMNIMKTKEEITAKINQLQSLEKAIMHRVGTINEDLKKIGDSIDTDTTQVESSLKIPRMDTDDLTPQIFGVKLLNWMERITYWVDFARRRMPKGSRQNQITMVMREPAEGTSIHFGKMAAYPALLLYKADFFSELSEETKAGRVRGTLTGLTSDPPIYGRPMELELEADIPGKRLESGKFTLSIDHTLNNMSELLNFSIASLMIENLTIIDNNDLRFSIEKAVGSLDASIAFQEHELKAGVKTALYQVQYQISSRFKKLEETLRDILKSSQSIDLVAKVEGPLDKPKLEATSNLGKQLALGLQEEFKHQIAVVRDQIRQAIEERITIEQDPLLSKYRQLQQEMLDPIRGEILNFKGLMLLANQALLSLDPRTRRYLTGQKTPPQSPRE